MTPLTTLLAERLAFKPCGSNNFGDVMRDEGVQWENARTKPITDQLVKVVEAAEALLVWAKGNHKMPNYSEVIANTDEALSNLKKAVKT